MKSKKESFLFLFFIRFQWNKPQSKVKKIMKMIKHVVDIAYYTFRKATITHMINKDLPISLIRIPKSEIHVNEDGSIRSKYESIKSNWPKLSCTARPMGKDLEFKLVFYGDRIAGLLALNKQETEKDFLVIASFDQKSNKWIEANDDLENEFKKKSIEV